MIISFGIELFAEMKGPAVWQEMVRLTLTWVVMCGLVAFFYWMLGNIGTF
ncbi:hypothetical protein [Mycobacterium sp. GA-1285]|nr:hypothetical protein [Mycobacterium sp. GA-1285]